MTRAKVRGSGDLKRDTADVEKFYTEQRAARRAEAASKRALENAKPTVATPKDAKMVRIRHLTWFTVVRVNQTTVTVEGDYNRHTKTWSTWRYPLVDVVAVAR